MAASNARCPSLFIRHTLHSLRCRWDAISPHGQRFFRHSLARALRSAGVSLKHLMRPTLPPRIFP